MAEEFGLEEVLRHGAAVEATKGLLRRGLAR